MKRPRSWRDESNPKMPSKHKQHVPKSNLAQDVAVEAARVPRCSQPSSREASLSHTMEFRTMIVDATVVVGYTYDTV